MKVIDDNRNEAWAVAGLLTGRYGRLALTRAAGEAAAAEKIGDKERRDLFRTVIAQLRQAMGEVRPNIAL